MLSWNFLFRIPSCFPARLLWGWSVLIVLLAAPSAFADEPIRVEAEVQADADAGAPIEITTGDYPPANAGGWFAFEPGSGDEVFSINESTGRITLNHSDKLNGRQQAARTFLVEHGRADETRAHFANRKFLRAAGLTDREISRRLGLVTRYEITLRIKPRLYAPEFPPRPLHFFWPVEGETVSEVQAQDSDPGDEIRYRLTSQEPENWIAIDPRTGALRLTTEGAAGRTAQTSWRGIVEATDGFGLKTSTTVWITEPLALPTLSVPSLKNFWPGESLGFIRGLASEAWDSLSSIKNSWRFDPARWANQSQPTTPSENPSPNSNSASVNVTSQASKDDNLPSAGKSEAALGESSTTWVLALLATGLAALLYVIFRHSRSRKVFAADAKPSDESPALCPPQDHLTPSSGGEHREIPKTPSTESEEQMEAEFEWEHLVGSADGEDGDDREPEDDSLSRGAPLETPSGDLLSPATRTSVESFGPASFPSLDESPSAKTAMTLPRPHVDLPIAAFQRDPLAILLDKAGLQAPSTEEVETLLSLLDDQLQGEAFEPATASEETELPEPKREAKTELSISDYMSNLMSKYMKPGFKPAAEESAESPPLAETSPADQNQTSPHRQSAGIPKPVFSYNRETTRSQLEQLRATSNRTAANAIRKAASRRLRRSLVRWGLLVLVGSGIYAARLFLFN